MWLDFVFHIFREILHEQLQKYIGGEIKERKWGFDSTMGKYGTIWLEQVKNENDIYIKCN
jgi:hypothetical protein|tara:strand:- start:180 stop:359 length:180 start_codon:yes stop_codon:yes gene_type:complete